MVDPLDETLEFVAGVESGRVVAGGVCNPKTREVLVGSVGSGVTYNGKLARHSERSNLAGAVVLASRSEVKRGDWNHFQQVPFVIRPMGSIAYKLALVSAGLADATWTLSPKNEWDIAAGVALVKAAGGFVRTVASSAPTINNKSTINLRFFRA